MCLKRYGSYICGNSRFCYIPLTCIYLFLYLTVNLTELKLPNSGFPLVSILWNLCLLLLHYVGAGIYPMPAKFREQSKNLGRIYMQNLAICFFAFFFLSLFIYFKERERDWTQVGGGTKRGRSRAPLPPSQDPDSGLDPRTLRSWPELKLDV